MRAFRAAAAVGAALAVTSPGGLGTVEEAPTEALGMDDECIASVGTPGGGCALSALQRSERQVLAGESGNAGSGSGGSRELGLRQAANASGQAPGPPQSAVQYNGVAWPEMVFPGTREMHIFAIGDWGGLDGSATSDMIFYKGGHLPGPHVFPRSRVACSMRDLQDCFASEGEDCKGSCGWVKGVDDQAQLLVAAQMRARAATSDPSFVLNVGDNFYQGGIWMDCGAPMDQLSPMTLHQFDSIFEQVYHGAGLDGKKWLSVLGNHDWGGFQFNHAWDQQIAYTWHSPRWVMPAVYWSQLVHYPDQGFSAEFFMLDSNAMDAKPPNMDPDHNLCGPNNPPEVSCKSSGGPASKGECHGWFRSLWREQQRWLEQRLQESTADWQVVVTHFPCGFESPWFLQLYLFQGLDLLVTGHRHDQELWHPSRLGGLACFVTGGGGGITSEKSPGGTHSSQYGFFDLTISKRSMAIESINYNGVTIGKQTVYPRHVGSQGRGTPTR